jgi:hypothetical protein
MVSSHRLQRLLVLLLSSPLLPAGFSLQPTPGGYSYDACKDDAHRHAYADHYQRVIH